MICTSLAPLLPVELMMTEPFPAEALPVSKLSFITTTVGRLALA